MKILFYGTFGFLLSASSFLNVAHGQNNRPLIITPDTEKLMAGAQVQGQVLCDAVTSKDFSKVADQTYPPVLEMMGGRQKAIAFMTEAVNKNESSGTRIKSNTVTGLSELIDTGDCVYAVLPETLIINLPQGRGRQDSFLLGVSRDHGATWKFVDGAGGEPAIRKLLPALPTSVVLPDRPKLVILAERIPTEVGETRATTMPAEVAEFDAAAEQWVSKLKGKTEAEIKAALGTEDCVRGEWKSGNYGGLKLRFKVDDRSELTLMFANGHVLLAHLDIETQ